MEIKFLRSYRNQIQSEVSANSSKCRNLRLTFQEEFPEQITFELRFTKIFIHLTARETIDVITVLYLKEESEESNSFQFNILKLKNAPSSKLND